MTKTPFNARTAFRAIVPAVLLPLLFVAAFITPAHHPRANNLPVAVAGPPAAAQPLLRALGDVNVVRVSGAVAAQHAVRDRRAYGAIVLGPRPSVDIASGESFVVATLLRQDAIRAGIAPGQIKDLAPLPSGDPRGVTLNLVALALIVAAVLSATIIVMALRDLRPGRTEAVLAGVALAAGAGTTGLVKAYSALPGPFLAETAEFAGAIFAVSLVAAGLIRLRGQLGTSLAFLVFLVIANPGSGLASAPDLLPAPWKQVGPLMPPGAGGQAIRGSAFFGGAANLGPILVLVAWIMLGVTLNALGYRTARREADIREADTIEPPTQATAHVSRPGSHPAAANRHRPLPQIPRR